MSGGDYDPKKKDPGGRQGLLYLVGRGGFEPPTNGLKVGERISKSLFYGPLSLAQTCQTPPKRHVCVTFSSAPVDAALGSVDDAETT